MNELELFDEWWIKESGYAAFDERGESIILHDRHRTFYDLSKAAWLARGKVTPIADEEKIPYAKIINICNTITKKSFKVTDTYKKHIRARWVEGMREADFERVCNTKNAQWKDDPAMRPFLRPETLFGTKMNSYANETPPKKPELEEWQ